MIEQLPAINAVFNSISFVLLCTGFVLIKQGKWKAHGIAMSAALLSSSLFLVGYLVHKVYYPDIRISTRFPNLGDGWKYTYWFVILIPHLILAIVMLPFIAKGVWHAYLREWDKHRAVNRYTIWIWLYVSLTGVLIYYLLYHLFPQLNGQ